MCNIKSKAKQPKSEFYLSYLTKLTHAPNHEIYKYEGFLVYEYWG